MLFMDVLFVDAFLSIPIHLQAGTVGEHRGWTLLGPMFGSIRAKSQVKCAPLATAGPVFTLETSRVKPPHSL